MTGAAAIRGWSNSPAAAIAATAPDGDFFTKHLINPDRVRSARCGGGQFEAPGLDDQLLLNPASADPRHFDDPAATLFAPPRLTWFPSRSRLTFPATGGPRSRCSDGMSPGSARAVSRGWVHRDRRRGRGAGWGGGVVG